MKVTQTAIPDVLLIEPTVFTDGRGWFMESFNEQRFHAELRALGMPIPPPFVQDNHSCSRKGVLRGLHYQVAPHAQGKLVRVLRGAAFDVAVDIRIDSPTYAQSVGIELDAENHRMLWIPQGFAHGFLALKANTHFFYKTTSIYCEESERILRWDDPGFTINWPRRQGLIISRKDASAPLWTSLKR